uniref:Uncharacterized protein LOC113796540 n=1 Tax=Dermatophagoides pteronyssinus TaxID=6956 RepID=A0A6P6YB22_DERPT
NIINDCFEFLKFYVFRLEYSLNDYERRQIPQSYQTFRLAIWLTLNSWINTFFSIHLALYPSEFFSKISKSFEQSFHLKRVDLLFQLQIPIFIILEYQWLNFLQKILHYQLKINNLFYKYYYHSDDYNQLKSKYIHYYTHYIHIYHIISKIILKILLIVLILSGLFGIFTFISEFMANNITFISIVEIGSKITTVYICIFLSKQNEMNFFNISLILYIVSGLLATNILYSKVAQLPYNNQRGCLLIMNWLARSQYQQQQQQQQLNNGHDRNVLQSLSIRNTIRLNQFAQSMSDNHLGFSCGQIFIITKYKFIEIFLMNFQLVLLFYKK